LIVKARKLSRYYMKGPVVVKALKDADINIKEGEFVAIMGPSGSGKSTLLHQLGLLDMPTKGALEIDGIDVLALDDYERSYFRLHKLGYVFQEYALIKELTAFENVSVPARMQDIDKEEYTERTISLLNDLGMEGREHHLPSELSGGEQQRIAIGRALINKPKILFADEPTANLDTQNANHIVDLFRKLNKKTGQTIVMVTHEKHLGKKADRIVWLKDGVIQKKAVF
jgi:putative ABC transport system ATP-binding protein